MKFRDPKSIQEAVVTMTHIQGASRIFGNRGEPTARQVSFEDKPTTEAPSTDMDRLQGVVRQLLQLAVTNKVTPTSVTLAGALVTDHRTVRTKEGDRLRLSPASSAMEKDISLENVQIDCAVVR